VKPKVPQIDLDDPARNMFGILPCPRCGSRFRVPTRPDHPEHPNCILCDDCGREEALDDPEDEPDKD
jgi:hypothetical protein